MRQGKLGLFFTGLVFAATVSVALAGGSVDPVPGDEVLGSVAGVRYVSEADTQAFGFDETHVSCGGHSSPWHPTGGGAKFGASAAVARIDGLRSKDLDAEYESPDNSKRDDWWATAMNSTVLGTPMTSFVVCVKRKVKYRYTEVGDDDSGNRSASRRCRPNEAIVGGGSRIATADSWIHSFFPPNKREWKSKVSDSAGGVGGFDVEAFCLRGIKVKIRSGSRQLPGSGSASATARCGKGFHVLSGGFAVSGSPSKAHNSGSYPFDNGDPDQLPDDGWKARAFNLTGASKTLTAYAVCVKRA